MVPLLAADLAAGAAFLRAHPSIDKDRVGFAGGSQAGWIIPVAATMTPEARFAVIISGPTISVGRQIYYFDLADGTTATQAELSAALAAYTGPDGFDPLPTLESVGLPILWLYGGHDRAVPTPESVAILRSLVDTQRKPFTWKIYPTAGHQLAVDFWPTVDAWLAALP
jgi:dienelactone hydrolase